MKTKDMYKPLKKIQIKRVDVTALKSRASEQKMAARGALTN
ncbi:hypothetical protein [Bartonella sp. ML70XJBT]|nr:hypothetical protein [Bartonella sp. ML70XJBT]